MEMMRRLHLRAVTHTHSYLLNRSTHIRTCAASRIPFSHVQCCARQNCQSPVQQHVIFKHIRHLHSCIFINYCNLVQTKSQLPPCLPHSRCYSSRTSKPLTINDERIQRYLTTLLERLIKLQTAVVSGTNSLNKAAENKEIVKLQPIVSTLEDFNKKEQELMELQNIGEGMTESEREQLEALTREEVERISAEMEVLEARVSAGVGGSEAFLFTRDIFDMYRRYASYRGWHSEVVESDVPEGVSGGLRKASISVSGEDIYRSLKYEGGVHRVQRVPKTEKQGRVHTSTAAVAIMPQPTEIDIQVNPKDLKIETYKSSGAGGQHVQTTDSAVRIRHLPSGMVVECQTSRSQIRNKATALTWLRSRLYEKELAEKMLQENQARRIQIGTAGRSEKIRTYNYKQDRITDHRLSDNVHGIEQFLTGNELLDEVIDSLHREARNERILELIKETKENKR